jgi:drug/metabolite transporter (DMT)-like permease
LRGETFPTPFAKPRGKGPSAPTVNFLWGAFNLLVGVYLLSRHPVTVGFEPGFLALVAGALAIGIYLSLHFGKVRRDRSSGS